MAGGATRRPSKRSKKQQTIYRRRRIVVGIAALLTLSLTLFCVYSIGRGIGAVSALITHESVALDRENVSEPLAVKPTADCDANSVSLSLSAASQSVGVGGSLDFTATIVHEGDASCLVNGADDNRVLTITSGNETIWRSDVCPAVSRPLLMAKGDKDSQTITWNANRTGSECVDDSELPRVDRGTYVAQLSLKDAPKAKSDSVTITVE